MVEAMLFAHGGGVTPAEEDWKASGGDEMCVVVG